jgi:acetyl esterase/lipase
MKDAGMDPENMPPMTLDSLAEVVPMMDYFLGEIRDLPQQQANFAKCDVKKVSLAGQYGANGDKSLMVVTPKKLAGKKNCLAIFDVHGGACIGGSPDANAPPSATWAVNFNAVVFNV